MKNFRKAYIDRVENIPLYESDYAYYLYERFLYEYLPDMINLNIQSKESEVSIAARDIEEYIKDIIRNDVMRAVKNGTLKIDGSKPVCKIAGDIDKDKEEEPEISDSLTSMVYNYAEKFVYYVPLVNEYILALPFIKSENGHAIFNLMEAFDYYDEIEQLDYSVSPKTLEGEEFVAHTREVFNEKIVNYLIPALIEEIKNQNGTKVKLSYSIDKGVAKFGSLEFNDVDLYEFGRCINRLPLKDLTDYETRSEDGKIQNVYEFEFTLQDLEEFYKKEQLKAYTREIFKKRIILSLIPSLINIWQKASDAKTANFEYNVHNGVINIYGKEISGVDLKEFYLCMRTIPCQSATAYSELRRKYTFEFNLNDLIEFYNNEKQKLEEQALKF